LAGTGERDARPAIPDRRYAAGGGTGTRPSGGSPAAGIPWSWPNHPGPDEQSRWLGDDLVSRRRLVLHLIAVGLLASALMLILLVVQHRARTDLAIVDAENRSLVAGRRLVEPALGREIVTGQRPAMDRLDRVVHDEVLTGSLLRVKLWRPDGTIVYSDEPRLIGNRFSLSDAHRVQLTDGTIDAAVADMVTPEHRYEPDPRMLEVYTPVRAEDGTPLLLETYFRYGGVTDAGVNGGELALLIALLCTLGLVVVEVLFARGLLRSARSVQCQQHRLVTEAVDAERRRIAGGLHDGVVQDLTGASLQLAAVGGNASADMGPVATAIRESIRSLRSLLVDIYPPSLHTEGLDAAIADLLAPLDDRGIATHLFVGLDCSALAPRSAEVLYRAVQEALRNVAVHAGARTVRVSLTAIDGDAMAVIEDDGRGFLAGGWHQLATDGHIGLKATQDLLTRVGGRLNIRSFPGEGTRVTARVRRYQPGAPGGRGRPR
jgi:two-component system NarL family sensor kinase